MSIKDILEAYRESASDPTIIRQRREESYPLSQYLKSSGKGKQGK